MATKPRIAIIGGGLSGFILLRTLHVQGVTSRAIVSLYERDLSFSARSHLGGCLDLHNESGQKAMRENGLKNDFVKHARPEGQEMRLIASSGELTMALGGSTEHKNLKTEGPGSRPEIDRTILRQIIVDACPSSSIHWGHTLVSISASPSLNESEFQEHTLTFSNGETTTCDLLIGADGAWSHVRPLLSQASVGYCGVTGAEISIAPEVVAANPEVGELVGMGMMVSMEVGKALMVQRNGDGRIRVYAWFREDEKSFNLPKEAERAKEMIAARYLGWSPKLLRLIELADPKAIYPRPLYYLPVGHQWEHKKGVSLVGDAGHLMCPFAGEGANLALLDGLELGLSIGAAFNQASQTPLSSALEKEIATFEEQMFVRTEPLAQKSAINLEKCMELGNEAAKQIGQAMVKEDEEELAAMKKGEWKVVKKWRKLMDAFNVDQ